MPLMSVSAFRPVLPRFGFGGVDELQQPRPLPNPADYSLTVRRGDFSLRTKGEIKLQSRFVDEIYQRVFRSDLQSPGFVVISGLGPLLGGDMQKVRAFQLALGEKLGQYRSGALNLPPQDAFSLKYLGRSNKAKKNPMHLDTKSTDSFVLMLYEAAKNIKACPFFTDMTQYAQDKRLDPLQLIQQDPAHVNDGAYKVKTHYGHQVDKTHQPEMLEKYTCDLTALDPNNIQLVVFNDSLGTSNRGLSHGMRLMDIPNPAEPSERYFNHVVFDVQNRELGRPLTNRRVGGEPTTYFEKGLDESEQTPVSYAEAAKNYVETGKIYYRNPNIQLAS
jgi:hypothetical protein